MTGGFKAFTVKPTSVKVGGSVNVKGARGDKLDVLLPNGTSMEITLDKNGKAVVKEPLGREGFFSITDFHPKDPHTVKINVYSL